MPFHTNPGKTQNSLRLKRFLIFVMIPAGVFGVFYFILPMLIYFAKDSYPEVSILARGVGAPRLPPGLVCCRHITGALES